MYYVIHKDMKKYSNTYKNTLINDVIPFWETHSIDNSHAGYLTCLDQKGNQNLNDCVQDYLSRSEKKTENFTSKNIAKHLC